MSESLAEPVSTDLEWCYDVVQDVSRTFALTISELEEPLAREICVGYLMCRVADTIEDATHIPPDAQVALLDTYRSVLESGEDRDLTAFMHRVAEWIPAAPTADWQVVAGTPRVIRVFRALPAESRSEIRPRVLEMIDGMSMFIERYADDGGLRIQTMDELEEYCWYVAGTVGFLVTGLVTRGTSSETASSLYEYAAAFGLLLQLVNVAKDIVDDYESENNVYVPSDVLSEHGLGPADIESVDEGSRFAPVVVALVERAEAYTDEARQWLDEMPLARGNTTSAWAVPYLLAVGTLRELKDRPGDVITDGDVKVGRDEVLAVVSAFEGDGVPSVAELRDEIRREPFTP
jgi:farnesyl-diphosphate farnesyltransferase